MGEVTNGAFTIWALDRPRLLLSIVHHVDPETALRQRRP